MPTRTAGVIQFWSTANLKRNATPNRRRPPDHLIGNRLRAQPDQGVVQTPYLRLQERDPLLERKPSTLTHLPYSFLQTAHPQPGLPRASPRPASPCPATPRAGPGVAATRGSSPPGPHQREQMPRQTSPRSRSPPRLPKALALLAAYPYLGRGRRQRGLPPSLPPSPSRPAASPAGLTPPLAPRPRDERRQTRPGSTV